MKYNGWANYETWNVHLWLTNEPGSCAFIREKLQSLGSVGPGAKWLEEFVSDSCFLEEFRRPSGASMAHDLLGRALCNVDWREVVEAFLED